MNRQTSYQKAAASHEAALRYTATAETVQAIVRCLRFEPPSLAARLLREAADELEGHEKPLGPGPSDRRTPIAHRSTL